MMDARRVRTASTDQLSTERFAEIDALCAEAFGFSFERVWERVGQGIHVTADVGRQVVAHAMIVDRHVYIGAEPDTALDAAYVENVATLPEAQGQGHATAVMEEVARIIGEEYEIGALGTRDQSFYTRLGWAVWGGQTSVRTPDGERLRTPGSDGEVMVLRTPRTPPSIAPDEPIAIEWRPGEPW
jgi:GNAT superfamily N-acetyltransferase